MDYSSPWHSELSGSFIYPGFRKGMDPVVWLQMLEEARLVVYNHMNGNHLTRNYVCMHICMYIHTWACLILGLCSFAP